MNSESFTNLSQSSKVNDSIVILRSILEQMSQDIRELRQEISELKKPKYNLLLGFAGIMLTVVAGLWGLAISPIRTDLEKKADKELVAEQYATEQELTKLTLDVNNRFNMIPHGTVTYETKGK